MGLLLHLLTHPLIASVVAGAQAMLPIHNSVEDMQQRDGTILPALTNALDASTAAMLDVQANVSQDSLAQVQSIGNILKELQQHVKTCSELPPQVRHATELLCWRYLSNPHEA